MKKKKPSFDYETFKKEGAERLKNGGTLLGKDGLLTPLIKDFLEESLEGELETHLEEESNNRKNGKGKKRVRTGFGSVEIQTPRDRKGSFTPKVLPKRQRSLGSGLDRQIIALYAKGNSYSDIRDHLLEIFGVEISTATISRITDKILPLVQEWKNKPLEGVYPFVWLDAIHYKVRHEGRVISKAVYCIIGVNQEGYKELLGMYLGQNEGAKYWLQVLTDLKSRGVEDIFIACIDNLTGFAEAIESIFPQTEVQLCVVHQIRNSKKYIAWKDVRAFMKDLKKVYQSRTKDGAELQLEKLESTWGSKYPVVINSWKRNWDRLSNYFQYVPEIRKIIYVSQTVTKSNKD